MINKNWITKTTDVLVKFIGISLLIFSIISIIQGFYDLRVSFNEGRFGLSYHIPKGKKHLEITSIVEGFPADLAGLKKGDRILYLNGKAVSEINLHNIWGEALAGTRMTLTVQREDQMLDIRMTRRLMPLMDRVIRILYLLILPALMLAFILVGLWITCKHYSYITRLIALVCFFFGSMIIAPMDLGAVMSPFTEYLYYSQLRSIVVLIGFALTPAFWLLLFLNFPQKSKFYQDHKYLILFLVFLVPVVLVAGQGLFMKILGKSLFSILFFGFMIIYIFAGVYILSRGAKREQNVLKKRQYQLILFGIKYGALAAAVGSGSLVSYSLLKLNMPTYFGWLSLFLFLVTQLIGLIVPFTFLNSFLQKKILETESALRRRLRYIGATSILFLIYLLVAFFVCNWIISRFELTDTSLIVLIVLALSLTFAPIHSRVLRWLEEKLYPEKTKYKNALKEMIRRMASFIEESQILENLSRWISDTMGIHPIYATSIDSIAVAKIPLKVHSPRSVLAKIKDGSNFFWDEVVSNGDETKTYIDEEEKKWAMEKGISITVPMISRGEPVGVLSVGKKKNSEDFTGDDLEIFQEAAYHTAMALQNAKLQMEHLEKKRMDKELEVARDIQTRLMPREIPHVKGLEIHGEYQPCFEVGGDYFDIIPIDEDRTALVIADVSGKGVGAALLMSNLQASLKMSISFSLPLPDIVNKINKMIFDNSLASQFITFFICLWDDKTKILEYINAGHNPPLILTTRNRTKKLSPTGIGLGIKENQVYKSKRVKMCINDVLVIYTDGIEEFFNYRLEAFGFDRLFSCFRESRQEHPSTMIQHLFNNLKDFAKGEKAYYCDDLTIIVAKRIQ
jgi:serine phosphatase RsbU (regulator of sigma subunit)